MRSKSWCINVSKKSRIHLDETMRSIASNREIRKSRILSKFYELVYARPLGKITLPMRLIVFYNPPQWQFQLDSGSFKRSNSWDYGHANLQQDNVTLYSTLDIVFLTEILYFSLFVRTVTSGPFSETNRTGWERFGRVECYRIFQIGTEGAVKFEIFLVKLLNVRQYNFFCQYNLTNWNYTELSCQNLSAATRQLNLIILSCKKLLKLLRTKCRTGVPVSLGLGSLAKEKSEPNTRAYEFPVPSEVISVTLGTLSPTVGYVEDETPAQTNTTYTRINFTSV
ncbi:hypothetical protein WN51_04622 [Melipona quadrifasciata]|uniref:Uncharacterized protein n=1 Tax=Melipona quadrifasciata TaxID=166423 RepID=A0A0M8ZUB3_9HYME|nr:hypothetical protein WN51_04622 [Melipona quadrifasciata]